LKEKNIADAQKIEDKNNGQRAKEMSQSKTTTKIQ